MLRAVPAALLLASALCLAQPIAVTPDGGRYTGSMRDGKLHGLGKLEWDTGARYEGAFQDGLFHGRGKLVAADGRTYTGDFLKGLFDGRGRFDAPSGEVYEGDFVKGEFTGRGTYSRPDGVRYRGEFLKWRMHGEGRYTDASGDVYEGSFVDGEMNGPGKVTFAKPRRDGRTEASGNWRNGRLIGDPEALQAAIDVETALLGQRPLLDKALAQIAAGQRGRIELYLLAVAGDGTQEVFRREVDFVRRQFKAAFATEGRSVALINSRNTLDSAPMATVSSIGESIKAIAGRMNRDEDILFVFLTSHGSRDHELRIQQSNMTLRGLPAVELARMLKESGIRWKVVVVSACYSGGFIEPLKDDGTLVITAARHDRSSFGCADENEFTYFGRAFFKEALPSSRSFEEAFASAAALVDEWEKKEQPREPRSEPQIWSPPAIVEHLRQWRAQLPKKE